MKGISVVVAAIAAVLPICANAASPPGLYARLSSGLNFMEPEDGHAGNTNGQIITDPGVALVGAVGWNFGNGPRIEVEGSYRANDISGEAGFGARAAVGTESKFGFMANALFDFDMGSWITPYIGFGIGYQLIDEPGAHIAVGPISANILDTTKGSFAYQAIVGAAFPIDAVPGLDLTFEYRYLSAPDDRRSNGTITIQGVGSFPTPVANDDFNHSILFGARYAF
ncbi:MAG TPA: outer membrane beta-barrel protein [Alphaproteobacteria bacterium]|jgi:opacity protein-like surface antigen|nr:outer membrane beta-barrel protein [Alphaproteobacteria bacterium]